MKDYSNPHSHRVVHNGRLLGRHERLRGPRATEFPAAHRNPYRTKEPDESEDWLVVVLSTTEGASVRDDLARPYRMGVTEEAIWLDDGRAIPLSALTDVALVGDGTKVRLVYRDVIDGKTATLIAKAGNLTKTKRHSAMGDFVAAIERMRAQAPSFGEFFGEEFCATRGNEGGSLQPGPGSSHVQFGCEHPGCQAETYFVHHTTSFYGLGVLFTLYFSATRERRQLLCDRHATRATLLSALRTALLGQWGLPAVFVAPIRSFQNSWSYAQSFPWRLHITLFALLLGMWPLAFVGTVIVAGIIHDALIGN